MWCQLLLCTQQACLQAGQWFQCSVLAMKACRSSGLEAGHPRFVPLPAPHVNSMNTSISWHSVSCSAVTRAYNLRQIAAFTAQLTLPCLQGCVGLRNRNLNCYANAVLQCLTAIPEWSRYFLSGSAERGPGQLERPVTAALSALLRTMWLSHGPVDPMP